MDNETKKKIRFLSKLVFIIYIIVLIYCLFFSEYYGRTGIMTEYQYNLKPFKEISRYLKYSDRMGFKGWLNLYGNIIVFIPFGIVAPLIDEKRRKFLIFLLTIIFITLSIEITQLLAKVGRLDVDDMLLNVFGAVIGFIMYKLAYIIYRRNKEGKNG